MTASTISDLAISKEARVKYFAAIQTIRDLSQIEPNKVAHVEFLERLAANGTIVLRGRFIDGSGGLTIFRAPSLEEARAIAESDPYVQAGARNLDLHEWNMTPKFEELQLSRET